MDRDAYVKKLFHIKGKRNVRVQQVSLMIFASLSLSKGAKVAAWLLFYEIFSGHTVSIWKVDSRVQGANHS